LVDDLKVIPKDPDPPKKAEPSALDPKAAAPPAEPEPPAGAFGGVKVTVDTVTRAGAMVSGRATFSDGQSAAWLIAQSAGPGLRPDQMCHRRSAAGMQDFQVLLEQELVRLGY